MVPGFIPKAFDLKLYDEWFFRIGLLVMLVFILFKTGKFIKGLTPRINFDFFNSELSPDIFKY